MNGLRFYVLRLLYVYVCIHTCIYVCMHVWAMLVAQTIGKESACNLGDLGLIPGSGGSPEKGMATHSSILA